ncbi:MAG: hypothetical protein IJV70_04350 [Clostridia bacterium]|nr:hypothetical protein [Clostridia bacterium]
MQYSETIKTAENDFIHLTVNDNGTLVISDKQNGNVYFEMLTYFGRAALEDGGIHSSYSGYTSVTKFSFPEQTYFDIHKTAPCKVSRDLYAHFDMVNSIASRVTLMPNERALRVTALLSESHGESEVENILRFPTGADYPTVTANGEAYEINTPFTLSKGDSVTVMSENGSAFRISEVSEDVTVTVSEDGNIDIVYPLVTVNYRFYGEYSKSEYKFSYVLEPIDAN